MVVDVRGGGGTSPYTRLRVAGRHEHLYVVRSRLGVLSWVVNAAKYCNGAGATLDKPTVFSALEVVVRNEPALASRPEYLDSSVQNAVPVWVRLPSVDLNRIVEFRDESFEQLQAIVETLYATPVQYPDDLPPWKLLVLRDGTVAFVYEHTIGDGQSGVAFHVAFLNALRKLQEFPADHSGVVKELSQGVSLLHPTEEAVDVSVPFMVLFREILKMFWPPARRKAEQAWTGAPVPESIVSGTHVRILHFTPEDGKHLVELSREHKTTLTGTLHTVALLVLSRLVRGEPDATKYRTIATVVPISLRRFSGAPQTSFCNHVSVLQDYYPLLPATPDAATSADDFPWNHAAALTEALKREAPRSGSTIGLLKYLGGKYEGYLRGMLGKKRAAGLELSNLGPFPAKLLVEKSATPTGQWDAREMLFFQSDAMMGAAFMLNVAGTPAGGLGVTVTWGKQSVGESFGEQFVAGFKAGVDALLASQHNTKSRS